MAMIAIGVVLGVGAIQSAVNASKQKKVAKEAAEYRRRQMDEMVKQKFAEMGKTVKEASEKFDEQQQQLNKIREILIHSANGNLSQFSQTLRELGREEFAFLGTKPIDAASNDPEIQEAVMDLLIGEQARRAWMWEEARSTENPNREQGAT